MGAFFITAAASLAMCACASMGRPEGGPRDETPPVYVRSTPVSGALNFSGDRLDVWFDENVQLEDAFNKVIVSPTQKQAAVVRSLGKRVTVELRDTLLPNTTYTIDFADAIKDLNEGNILDGFALDFSTGSEIDTLRLSGIVLEGRTLEPAQGMTVGIYAEPLTDTTLTKVPFQRIARTNQYGQFTVRNLKPGRYAVFALNDLNRDNKWDRSEDVAFLGSLVQPYVENIQVNDTLRTAAGADSIVTHPGVAYYPNDILLTWFNEDYRSQYLRDHARPERHRVTLGLGAPSDTFPELTIVGGPLNGDNLLDHSLLQYNTTRDTLTYWLKDPEVLAIDSLLLDVRHQYTDTLEQLSWKNDTIRFFWREPKKKKEDKKKEQENDSVPKIDFLPVQITSGTAHEIYAPIRMALQTPIDSIRTDFIHLETMVDSVWKPAELKPMEADVSDPYMAVTMDFDRRPGQKYRLTVDSLAVYDIYGHFNKPLTHEFTVRTPEEYSNLSFTITHAPDTVPVMVELLDSSDKPVRTVMAHNGRAEIKYLNPGTYYARLYLDADSSGDWTTGNIALERQPEEVYYFPNKLDLKANWDVSQNWDIFEKPLDAQKPYAIKQNKPKLKKGEKDPYDNTEQEYDEWGNPIDPNDPDYLRGSGGRRNNGNNRGNNRGNSFGGFGGLGGFQQAGGTTSPTLRR